WAMAYKPREIPVELRTLEALNPRMALSNKDVNYLSSLRQGYQGELIFDKWSDKLQVDCLVLNDLLLQSSRNTFQIDSLFITSKNISFFEIKNLDGDYYFEGDKFFKRPQYEVTNPLHQLLRSDSLLRQLLPGNGITLPVQRFLVFVNP